MVTCRDVLYALITCDTVQDVQRMCKLKPSRLRRILSSPRFRRALELERQYTAFRVRRVARRNARLAITCLANALNTSENDAVVVKAAVQCLRLALAKDMPAHEDTGSLEDLLTAVEKQAGLLPEEQPQAQEQFPFVRAAWDRQGYDPAEHAFGPAASLPELPASPLEAAEPGGASTRSCPTASAPDRPEGPSEPPPKPA